jgi:segregation and condensation protein B
MQNLKPIVESLLFVAQEPLTIERLKKVLPEADSKEIRAALAELIEEYDQRQGGFFLREVADGFQIRTRPEHSEWITRLIQPSPMRLSKAALETLAIIAYKQPIIRSDVEQLRGVDCGGILRVLLERKLIRVLGRKEIPGRPLIYASTKRFLEIFDLKSLNDLPTPKEIKEYGNSLAEQAPQHALDITDSPLDDETEPAAEIEPEADDFMPEPEISDEPFELDVEAQQTPEDAPDIADSILDDETQPAADTEPEADDFMPEPEIPDEPSESDVETEQAPEDAPDIANSSLDDETEPAAETDPEADDFMPAREISDEPPESDEKKA